MFMKIRFQDNNYGGKKSKLLLAWYSRSSIIWLQSVFQPYLLLFPNTSPLLQSGLPSPSPQIHHIYSKKRKSIKKNFRPTKRLKRI